ncbi:hypothetical protein BDD43_2691 [Mucilaginibacter gracilis]|uniref:Uncharacterized protein n=1 Tax=Mucilaginibacter gracilis TaxID=423350 RepID=A0A495J2C1_9SPHI|nr:hypothetical protein BDD43_2691 [Mucilaginibacter gracilis]
MPFFKKWQLISSFGINANKAISVPFSQLFFIYTAQKKY